MEDCLSGLKYKNLIKRTDLQIVFLQNELWIAKLKLAFN